jgi:hypothetical protein
LSNGALRHRVSGVTAVVRKRLAGIAAVREQRARRAVGASPAGAREAALVNRLSVATPTPIGTARVAAEALARRVNARRSTCAWPGVTGRPWCGSRRAAR